MHELHATQNIIDNVVKHANEADAKKVTDVFIVNGAFSTMVDDSIMFYWDMLSPGTICENARLHFTHVSARAVCETCGKTFEPEDEFTPCPRCSSNSLNITQGKEFFLNGIEVEEKQ